MTKLTVEAALGANLEFHFLRITCGSQYVM